MVVVKRLDLKYPRLGYEVQKGLMVDMPGGDGKAEIIEAEDGSVTLSERDGKYSVTLKNVQLSEFGNPQVRINLSGGPDANHLVLEDLKIELPNVTVSSFYGDNRIADTHFRGANHITMTGQTINGAYIDDSIISGSSIENGSAVEYSRLMNSKISDSEIINSDLDNVTVTDDSKVELSYLMDDTVKQANVGGVNNGWNVLDDTFDERTFENGYFVGNGKLASREDFDHGCTQVADEDAYADGLARLAVNRDLPFRVEKDSYQPSDDMKERLEKAWETVPAAYKDETLELAPFLKEIVELPSLTADEIARSFDEDDAWREADDFVIDESQFDMTPQQGLQQ